LSGCRPKTAQANLVEENKFASWEAAASFFTGEGFVIRRRLAPSDDPQHLRQSWVLALPEF
jgi:hypothetical protein